MLKVLVDLNCYVTCNSDHLIHVLLRLIESLLAWGRHPTKIPPMIVKNFSLTCRHNKAITAHCSMLPRRFICHLTSNDVVACASTLLVPLHWALEYFQWLRYEPGMHWDTGVDQNIIVVSRIAEIWRHFCLKSLQWLISVMRHI